MTLGNLVALRKDPTEINDGYQITVLHVMAVYNKLDELKAALEPRFDQQPKFVSEMPEIEDITTYRFKGTIKGINYEVYLKNIGCPVPVANAQIHHALVKLPEGETDLMTSIIEQEFRNYESELIKHLE